MSEGWSRDWGNVDWDSICQRLDEVNNSEILFQADDYEKKPDIGLSKEEYIEFFTWLRETEPELFYITILKMVLHQNGVPDEKIENIITTPELLKETLEKLITNYTS